MLDYLDTLPPLSPKQRAILYDCVKLPISEYARNSLKECWAAAYAWYLLAKQGDPQFIEELFYCYLDSDDEQFFEPFELFKRGFCAYSLDDLIQVYQKFLKNNSAFHPDQGYALPSFFNLLSQKYSEDCSDNHRHMLQNFLVENLQQYRFHSPFINALVVKSCIDNDLQETGELISEIIEHDFLNKFLLDDFHDLNSIDWISCKQARASLEQDFAIPQGDYVGDDQFARLLISASFPCTTKKFKFFMAGNIFSPLNRKFYDVVLSFFNLISLDVDLTDKQERAELEEEFGSRPVTVGQELFFRNQILLLQQQLMNTAHLGNPELRIDLSPIKLCQDPIEALLSLSVTRLCFDNFIYALCEYDFDELEEILSEDFCFVEKLLDFMDQVSLIIRSQPSQLEKVRDLHLDMALFWNTRYPSFIKKLEQLHADKYEYFSPSPINNTPSVGRNDPCTCGSGKKFKKCCLN